jgi:hypothetical protein
MQTFTVAIITALITTTSAIAADKNFYPMSVADLEQSSDLRAHSRSVEEYRKLVPDKADIYGMCRNAGHIAQCVWKINGHEYPPPEAWVKALKGY